MKEVFKHLITAAIVLTATTLQGCSDTEEKTGLEKDIEGVWESVYYHEDDMVYEYKGNNGEWFQYTDEGESYPITRDDEDWVVLKFVNGTVSFVAANDMDKEDAVGIGMKFPYQIKGDRITSLIFAPETTEGYYAIEDMTEDSFKLVGVEKGYYTEQLEYDEAPDRRIIHERFVTTFKRIK